MTRWGGIATSHKKAGKYTRRNDSAVIGGLVSRVPSISHILLRQKHQPSRTESLKFLKQSRVRVAHAAEVHICAHGQHH